MRQRLSSQDYIKGILTGDRMILSRAITVIESQLPEDRSLAKNILEAILAKSGNSIRIGISGVPGVGKSSFIEVMGKHIIASGKSVAVLTIDPSSKKSGGSILGDKTRMEKLVNNPKAFIRPTASSLTLGGIAQSTRESILLCEAAGYEIIMVETVGVGQSETMVKEMTDFFLLLMLAGAGDELQGVKKGIMEMADTIAINKADGENQMAAELAAQEYSNALHLFPMPASEFLPRVVTCSALEDSGIQDIWTIINEYHQQTIENGFFEKNRKLQNVAWMYDHIHQSLKNHFLNNPSVKTNLSSFEDSILSGTELPLAAAEALLKLYYQSFNTPNQ